MMAAVLAAAALGASGMAAEAPGAPPAACERSYAQVSALRGVRAVVRSPRYLGRARGRLAWRFANCGRTPAVRREARRELREGRAWRRSYGGYWYLRRARLPASTRAALRALRGCETRGIPHPWNYRHGAPGNPHNASQFDGAYQYLPSTWARAHGWTGAPGRYFKAPAYGASPAHQDVATAAYWPGHRGEWPNCP